MSNFNLGTARDLPKSNSTEDAFNWVMVATAGSLVIDQEGGNNVTLAAVPANVWIPVGNAIRIRTVSTAVGFMVV